MKKKPCEPSAKYHVGAVPVIAFSVWDPYCPSRSQRIVRSTTSGVPDVDVTTVDSAPAGKPATSLT